MKKNIPPQYKSLARKISGAEIVIVLILVLVWLSFFVLTNVQRNTNIDKMTLLQENILALALDDLTQQDHATGIAWPFTDTFSYLLIKDGDIIASNLDWLMEDDLTPGKAFGDFFNADEMIEHLETELRGTDWIRPDKISPRKWISWRSQPASPYVVALLSDENDLLDLSGHLAFKRAALVCTSLASALLLLALIWALSWMRLSAVKGLYTDGSSSPEQPQPHKD
ncbi:MAG TPA: hypothetical protein ENN05_03880 [Deltaproteobacteria bacterium]|nr:hypothetical protein [Deltaproteobacteria bacterium]